MKKFICVLVFFIVLWYILFYTKTYNGIDISHHNSICWKDIAEDSNIKFCYIKATEGKRFIDKDCENNVKNAKQINLLIGLYHYFRTNSTAKEQFNNFVKVADRIEFNLIPMIDVESIGNNFTDINKVNSNLSELISLFYNKYKVYPIIYFGTKEAYKTIPVAYKCPFWTSNMHNPNLHLNFTIKQYKIDNIGCNLVDLNYCTNISSILLNR